jgi:hypothetical protein
MLVDVCISHLHQDTFQAVAIDPYSRIQTVIRPLHLASHSANTTNLDFIQLLLEKGADPKAQNWARHR